MFLVHFCSKPGSVSCEDAITDEQITNSCKEAEIGINVAMPYENDYPESPASKDHTHVPSMSRISLLFSIIFLFG
jgi:hypothetical protein